MTGPRIMRYSLLPFLLSLSGCCVTVTTSVRNETGRDIQLTVIHGSHQLETITIRPASASRCAGVMPITPGDTPYSWLVSDGQSRFTYADVSPIATLPDRFISRSRFTSDFPCTHVTRHVRIAPDMTIQALRVFGYTESQPAQFPIRYTTKE